MTRDEAVAEIQTQLGFRTDQTAVIIRHLKLAQVTLELGPTKPWFMTSDYTSLSTVADTRELAIPTGFVQEIDASKLFYIPDSSAEDPSPVELVKDDFNVLNTQYASADAGPPEAYSLINEYFHIFPLPDTVYTLKLFYSKEQDLLTTNVENNWLLYAPLLIMGVAGQFTASALRDSTAKSIFMEWEKVGRLQLFNHDVARDVAGRTPQIGGPH